MKEKKTLVFHNRRSKIICKTEKSRNINTCLLFINGVNTKKKLKELRVVVFGKVYGRTAVFLNKPYKKVNHVKV